MKKALLIIDVPEEYEAEELCADVKVYDNEQGIVNTNVLQVKPLPRLKDYDTAYNMWLKHSAIYRSGNNKNALYRFVDGWEGCLDELEGKYDK